jgi:hypothetical protein
MDRSREYAHSDQQTQYEYKDPHASVIDERKGGMDKCHGMPASVTRY